MALPVMKTCGNFCKEISAAHRKISPVSPVLKKSRITLDWNATYKKNQMEGKRMIVFLWAFSLNGKIDSAPEISNIRINPAIPREFEEDSWEIRWKWPGKKWHLLIDPLSTEPLKET